MRTKLLIAVCAGALVALGASTPAGAGAGNPVVTVNKVVEGSPPPGTTFVVSYECTPVDNVAAPDSQGGEAGTVEFGPGGGSEPVAVEFAADCTFEETGTGGATSTTVAVVCEESQNCQQTGPNTVFFQLDSIQGPTAEFTFTNAFNAPPPPPPQPLPVEPAFTG